MFDVFLALIVARVLVISVRRRFVPGIVSGGGGALLWVALVASGWFGRGADALHMTGVLLLVFLGPSVTPGPTANVPWSAALAAHPVGAKLVMAAAFAVPFALAWRRAQRLSPLSDEASELKRLGLVYLVPALLVIVQAMCLEGADVASDWM